MSKKIKLNPFKLPLHKVCSNDNKLRKYLNYVHFVNDFAYATDAHIALKVSIDSLNENNHILNTLELKNLNGYSINIATYSFLQSCDVINSIKDGVISFSKGTINGTVSIDPFDVIDSRSADNKINVQLDKLINDAIDDFYGLSNDLKLNQSGAFGLNPSLLNKLSEAMFKDIGLLSGIRVRTTHPNRAILIDSPYYFNSNKKEVSRIGLIMPILISSND